MHVRYACQNVEGTALQPACLFVIIDCLQVLLYGSIHDRSNGKGFVIVQGAFKVFRSCAVLCLQKLYGLLLHGCDRGYGGYHQHNKGGGYNGHCHKELHFFVKLPSAYFLHPLSHKCSRPSSVFCSLSYHAMQQCGNFYQLEKAAAWI